MSGGDGMAWYRALELRLLQQRVERWREARLKNSEEALRALRESAAAKLASGSHLTREEFAAHLGVSPKKIQRMEGQGLVKRCEGMGTVVRFAASDVLRLASASSRKGA